MGLLSLTFMELAPISDNLLKNFISDEKEVLWESIQRKGLVFTETVGISFREEVAFEQILEGQ